MREGSIRRGIGAAGTAALCLVLAANLWLIAARVWLKDPVPSFFGFAPVSVLSGSMESSFSAGDMIIIHSCAQYIPGDIVTFQSEGGFVTHRIIGETGNGFLVKGDANNVRDEEAVPADRIVGKVVWIFPNAGRILLFFRTPSGLILLAAVWLFSMLPGSRGRRKENSRGDDRGRMGWREKR